MRNSQVRTTARISVGIMAPILIASIFAVALAEVALLLGNSVVSGAIHALLLLGYLNAFAFLDDYPYREVFLVLALVPLLRIISLTVPIPLLPPITWYLLVGAPVLIVVSFISRVVPLSWDRLKLKVEQLPGELAIAFTGIPVSLSAYLVLRPKPLVANLTLEFLLIGGAILLLFAGFLEELIFRALLPGALHKVFGSAELVFSTLLYASLFISSGSVLYVVLAGVIGLLYHLWVGRSGTIWGVVVSHSLWLVGMILIWPAILHL